jgi:hypothetical protein
MGGLLQFIFFLWLGWIVLVVIYHVVVEVFKFLKEVLGSLFDAPDPPSRPEPSQVQRRTAADSQRPDHEYRKPWVPDSSTGQPRGAPAIRLSGNASFPMPKRPAKLELAIDYNARLAGSSYLIVRVRGGPDGGRVGGITYSLSCTADVHQIEYALGDRRSIIANPEAFKGLYALNVNLPEDESWATLAVIPLDHVLPPRGGTLRYHFRCKAYASSIGASNSAPSTVGGVLNDAELTTILNLPGPGYLDEIDWLSQREKLVGMLAGLLQGCVVDVSDKRSKVRALVDAIDPPASSGARRTMLKLAVERAFVSAPPSAGLTFSIIDAVRITKDAVLIEAVARVIFQLACREPLTSEIRKAFAKIKANYDVIINGHHVSLIDPLPPAAPVKSPAPAPKPSPAVASFELRLEPVEEAGRMKAAEVYVRGFTGSLLLSQPELSFWLWDETSGDTPFLMSAADIDNVHERAVHVRSWKAGEYDPNKWQKAGMIMFNQVMPPSGGARRISVAGRLGSSSIFSAFSSANTARSPAIAMSIAGSGYEKIRIARQGLRYRAFVIAVGLALMSGKGPTYRQDKALKKFAQTLCAGIIDRKLAEGHQNDLLTLLDSNVDDSLYGLTKQLDHLADQSYPELKSQLLEALVEVMASRKARSKQSRHFLEYSRSVLA